VVLCSLSRLCKRINSMSQQGVEGSRANRTYAIDVEVAGEWHPAGVKQTTPIERNRHPAPRYRGATEAEQRTGSIELGLQSHRRPGGLGAHL